MFSLVDELGPELIIHISDKKNGLKAIVVVDNTAVGPTIGGNRMSLEVTAEEVARLTRAMTYRE